jgi:hypothetical protein
MRSESGRWEGGECQWNLLLFVFFFLLPLFFSSTRKFTQWMSKFYMTDN